MLNSGCLPLINLPCQLGKSAKLASHRQPISHSKVKSLMVHFVSLLSLFVCVFISFQISIRRGDEKQKINLVWPLQYGTVVVVITAPLGPEGNFLGSN